MTESDLRCVLCGNHEQISIQPLPDGSLRSLCNNCATQAQSAKESMQEGVNLALTLREELYSQTNGMIFVGTVSAGVGAGMQFGPGFGLLAFGALVTLASFVWRITK